MCSNSYLDPMSPVVQFYTTNKTSFRSDVRRHSIELNAAGKVTVTMDRPPCDT